MWLLKPAEQIQNSVWLYNSKCSGPQAANQMLSGRQICLCSLQAQALVTFRQTVLPIPRCQQARLHRLFSHTSKPHLLRAVDLRVAAPPVKIDHSGTADEVRKYLTRLGWDKAWIDGITERIYKKEFETSVSRVEEVVTYLEGLGISTHHVCNLASRVPAVLSKDPNTELEPVVQYIKDRTVPDELLVRLLKDSPRLLLFEVSSDGKVLHLDRARAAVDVLEEDGERLATVNYWREGAIFSESPVSPLKPSVEA